MSPPTIAYLSGSNTHDRDVAVVSGGRESDSVLETLEIMRFKGVRRLPTVDQDGQLVGIVTVDDLLEILAEELNELAMIVAREQSHEASARK